MTESRWFSDVTKEELHEEWKDLTLEKHSWAYCYGHGHEILRLQRFLERREEYLREMFSMLKGESGGRSGDLGSYRQAMEQYEHRFSKRLPGWLLRYEEAIQREVIGLTIEYDVPFPNEKELTWLKTTYAEVDVPSVET